MTPDQFPLLQIDSLTSAYLTRGAWMEVLLDVSLDLYPGQVIGLVGESGSGKTTLAMAVMNYLGQYGKIIRGQAIYGGRDLLTLTYPEMSQVWGKDISLVPQNSQSVLNPTLKVGTQVAEIFQRHEPADKITVQTRVLDSLRSVQLDDPERIAGSYPHQLSGGMQQRVLIAMATCLKPNLLILDEPTSNLDVTTQSSILNLLRELVNDALGVLYISHNLGIIAQTCDRVAVLYAGEIVETAPVNDLFNLPLHPYTGGLIVSIPKLGETKRTEPLRTIPGSIPPPGERPEGCSFANRCPLAVPICIEHPPLVTAMEGRQVRCHRWQDLATGIRIPWEEKSSLAQITRSGESLNREEVLSLKHVSIDYHLPRPWFRSPVFKPRKQEQSQDSQDELTDRDPYQLEAVRNVTLTMKQGKTLGLVGESGSGKTSLARGIAGLVEISSGEMFLLQAPLPSKLGRRGAGILCNIQLVSQNPDDSLNPYRRVGDSLSRPYISLQKISAQQARQEVYQLLKLVQLPESFADRMPRQLSGGEKQRLAIARAFALHPALLIADEPVSALDVSIQSAILRLLDDLQREQDSAILFISHDLAVVGYLADLIAVIFRGEIVETAKPETLVSPPHHPYTTSLLTAVPDPNPAIKENIQNPAIETEPGRSETTIGCPFSERCLLVIGDVCRNERPPWQEVGDGSGILCHLSLEELLQPPQQINSTQATRKDV